MLILIMMMVMRMRTRMNVVTKFFWRRFIARCQSDALIQSNFRQESELLIRNIEADDFGKYGCFAENEVNKKMKQTCKEIQTPCISLIYSKNVLKQIQPLYAYIQKVKMSADFAFQSKIICRKSA